MEASITNQSGGPAAETSNVNPNLTASTELQMQTQPNHQTLDNEQLVTLKKAAEQFDVYPGTLKNNIKQGKLPAQQENQKAAYFVKTDDVEKLLRTTPGIKSMFYPRESSASVSDVAHVTGATSDNDPDGQTADAGNTAVAVNVSAEPPTVAKGSSSNALNLNHDRNNARLDNKQIPVTHGGKQAANQSAETSSDAVPKKRRRRRHRGRGNSATTHEVSASGSAHFMKNLAGTTPGERLKITAFLNELAAMVASA